MITNRSLSPASPQATRAETSVPATAPQGAAATGDAGSGGFASYVEADDGDDAARASDGPWMRKAGGKKAPAQAKKAAAAADAALGADPTAVTTRAPALDATRAARGDGEGRDHAPRGRERPDGRSAERSGRERAGGTEAFAPAMADANGLKGKARAAKAPANDGAANDAWSRGMGDAPAGPRDRGAVKSAGSGADRANGPDRNTGADRASADDRTSGAERPALSDRGTGADRSSGNDRAMGANRGANADRGTGLGDKALNGGAGAGNGLNAGGPAAMAARANAAAMTATPDAPASPMLAYAAGTGGAAAESGGDNPVLLFLTGRVDQIAPEQITDVVIGNPFIAMAMAAGDVAKFCQTPQSTAQMLGALGVTPSQLTAAGVAPTALTPTMTPQQLFKALGLDAQSVTAELQTLQANLAMEGLTGYVARAETMQRGQALLASERQRVAGAPQQGSTLAGDAMAPLGDAHDDGQDVPAAWALAAAAQSGAWNASGAAVPANPHGDVAMPAGDWRRPAIAVTPATDGPRLGLTHEARAAMTADAAALAPETPFAAGPGAKESPDISFTRASDDPFASLFTLTRATDVKRLPDMPASAQVPMAGLAPLGMAMPAAPVAVPDAGRESRDGDEDAVGPTNPFLARAWRAGDANATADGGDAKPVLLDRRMSAAQLAERLSNPFEAGAGIADDRGGAGEREADDQGGRDASAPSAGLAPGHAATAKPTHHAERTSFAEAMAETSTADRAKAAQAVLERASLMVKEGGGSVRIDLGSQELGHIDLAMDVSGDRIDLRIVASSEEARNLIGAEMARLREALSQNNLNLRHVDVGLAGGQSWSQRQPGGGAAGESFREDRVIEEAGAVTRATRSTERRVGFAQAQARGAAVNPNGKIQILA